MTTVQKTSKTIKAFVLSLALIFTLGTFLVIKPASATSAVDVYRFYNTQKNYHFYTANEVEKNILINSSSGTFRYEGIAFRALSVNQTGTCDPGWQPIFRLYSSSLGIHRYTTDPVEKQHLINFHFRYEGIVSCVVSKGSWITKPVYKFITVASPTRDFYTISENEKNTLMQSPNWSYKGIQFHAFGGL